MDLDAYNERQQEIAGMQQALVPQSTAAAVAAAAIQSNLNQQTIEEGSSPGSGTAPVFFPVNTPSQNGVIESSETTGLVTDQGDSVASSNATPAAGGSSWLTWARYLLLAAAGILLIHHFTHRKA